MSEIWHDVLAAYQRRIVYPGKEPAFLILVSFLATFLLVRLLTHTIRREQAPRAAGRSAPRRRRRLARTVRIRGVHVHHLVPGIVLLLVTGYLDIALSVRTDRRLIAVFFGVGAGLTLDEFALWFHLQDVYWSAQGRASVRVVLVTAAVAGLVVLGSGFWYDLGHVAARALGAA